MLLALALYASTAHENTPHYDLDLLYHDGKAHRLDKCLRIWRVPSPRRGDTRPALPRISATTAATRHAARAGQASTPVSDLGV